MKHYQERKYYANLKKPSVNDSNNITQTITSTETTGSNKIESKSDISSHKDILTNNQEQQQEVAVNLSKRILELENTHSQKQQMLELATNNPTLFLNQYQQQPSPIPNSNNQQQQQLLPSTQQKKKKKKKKKNSSIIN